jgi:EAL domain-containing protein (putative c-di-GMP-specific phosphodiesterase class I)
LKIDQSFIRDLTSDPNDESLVTAIIAMANSMHLTVVAEGVETKEQLEILRNKGCANVQGFLFAKPMIDSEFNDFLALSDKKKKSV